MTTMQQQYYYATGRRKSAIAQVRLYMESGPVVVNGKPIEEAFPWDNWRREIMEPFRITHTNGQFRVVAKVTGGGVTGQAGALRHGISRALTEGRPESANASEARRHAHTRSPREGAPQVRPQESSQGAAVHEAVTLVSSHYRLRFASSASGKMGDRDDAEIFARKDNGAARRQDRNCKR